MSKKPFYVTTAIAYINADPHIGFAMECLQADMLARYHRMQGGDTYFLTGTDEHGTKLFTMAKEQALTPKELSDRNAKKFEALKGILNLSNDDFIRTSDQTKHWPSVVKLWNKLVESGDIYKGSYKGFYCVGCEAFVLEKDLVDGLCPIHKKPPEVLEEENYFFKLSKYTDQVAKLIESKELEIIPAHRGKEILNVVKDGLQDVSFSRPKKTLSWGVPVPSDPDQVMYVWCDALTNYISALDYGSEGPLYKKFWEGADTVHIIGKDILRFHAAIWPGMLLSAGAPLPKKIFVHGWVTSEGQKMSKSTGNVVDPLEVVEQYGLDPLRYYVLRMIPAGEDGDFTKTRFESVYQSDLANGLGNLLSRVLAMVNKYQVTLVQPDTELQDQVIESWNFYHQAMNDFQLHRAVEQAWSLVTVGNQYVDEKKPWVLAKEDQKTLTQVLSNLVEVLRQISILIYPILPTTSEKMRSQLGLAPIDVKSFNLEKEAEWGSGTSAIKVKIGEGLFPRLS